MAAQEIHCENQPICERWWAQRLESCVHLHQDAFVLVGQLSASSAATSLHDSCGPQHRSPNNSQMREVFTLNSTGQNQTFPRSQNYSIFKILKVQQQPWYDLVHF